MAMQSAWRASCGLAPHASSPAWHALLSLLLSMQGDRELAQAAGMSGGLPVLSAARHSAGTAAGAEPEGAAGPAPAAPGRGCAGCPSLAAKGETPCST